MPAYDTSFMKTDELIETLHPLERAVVPYLAQATTLEELVSLSKRQEVEVMRALQWLENKGVLTIDAQTKEFIVFGKFGQDVFTQGIPEKRFLRILQKKGDLQLKEIIEEGNFGAEVNACVGILKKMGSILVKEGMVISLTKGGEIYLGQKDNQEKLLEVLHEKKAIALSDMGTDLLSGYELLKKAKDVVKLVKRTSRKYILTPLGKELSAVDVNKLQVEEKLTSAMLRDGTWREKKFRKFDVAINVPKTYGGRKHPQSESIEIIRDVYLQMGFKEMAGPWVETAFWCMDSMWIPQDHPARDVQDTFYLDKEGELPSPELVNKVRRAHEDGLDTGSTGYGTKWDENKAKQLLMRTHSTATTFRVLSQLGNRDAKYFYIANNFRNEAIDATHLAEFLQAEGFIVGDNLTLADLMGFVKEFYAKLGITKIRFKPTYNPYTEPSMEAHYYDEKKKKWYALINSGIFRPESLAPYGITKSVIAWGMGATRVASLLTGTSRLKDMVGPHCGLDWLAQRQVLKRDIGD